MSYDDILSDDHLLIIDNLCSAFSLQRKSNQHLAVRQFVEAIPQFASWTKLQRLGLIYGLVSEDVTILRAEGKTASIASYFTQFPEYHEAIKLAFADSISELPAHYVLNNELGRGGMGEIWRVRDARFSRDLVVKTVRDEYRNDDELIRRFQFEADLQGSLEHPSIPPVHDKGTLRDGRPFFTMKLIEGKTLGELLRKRKSKKDEFPYFLDILRQVADAIGYAHSKGIIHRDIKPSNIMVGAFGEVQVMDWGTGKRLAGLESTVITNDQLSSERTLSSLRTGKGVVLGTLPYMPAEQAMGDLAIDQRADVFALGAILCEILTGVPPYDRPRITRTQFHKKVMDGNVEQAVARIEDSEADSAIVELAIACLRKDPSQRPDDANEVAAQIKQYQDSLPQKLQSERDRRNLVVWGGALLSIAAVIAMIAFFYMLDARDKTIIALEAETTERERANTNEAAALAAAKDTQIQLARSEFATGLRSRDLMGDRIRAGHRFFRAALAAQKGGDKTMMTNCLIAANDQQKAVHTTFIGDSGIYTAAKSHDGSKIAFVTDNGTLYCHDLATAKDWRLTGSFAAMAFPINGDYLLAWDVDGNVKLLDAFDGKVERKWKHLERVIGLQTSPSHKYFLTSSSDGAVQLCDTEHDEPIQVWRHGGIVYGASFSPNDENKVWTWSGDDATVRLWNAATDEPEYELNCGELSNASFDQQGKRLATWNDDGEIKLWNIATKQVERIFQHDGHIFQAVFSKSGEQLLTSSADNSACLWSIKSSEPNRRWRHDGMVISAAFDLNEERVLTVGHDTARLWDIEQDILLRNWKHSNLVLGATFTPNDNRVLTWSRDGSASLWDVATGARVLNCSHLQEVNGADFIGHETLLMTWSDDGTLRVWNVNGNAPINTHSWVLADQILKFRGAQLNSTKTMAVTWDDSDNVRLWDLATKQQRVAWRHPDGVYGAVFAPTDSRVLTWSYDGRARVWNVESRSQTALQVLQHNEPLRGAAFNATGDRILTWCRDKHVRVWNTQSGEMISDWLHNDTVEGAAFNTTDDRVLTWCYDGAMRVLLPGSDVEMQQWKNLGRVEARFHNDGKQVLTWSRDADETNLWDVATGDIVTTWAADSGRVDGVASNGQLILNWAGSEVRLWDASGQPVYTWKHDSRVRGARFDSKGDRVLSWSKDGTARLWDVDTGRGLEIWVHGGAVHGAEFNGAEERALTWGSDDTVKLWGVGSAPPVKTWLIHSRIRGAILSLPNDEFMTYGQGVRFWRIEHDDRPPCYQLEQFENKTGTKINASGHLRVEPPQ